MVQIRKLAFLTEQADAEVGHSADHPVTRAVALIAIVPVVILFSIIEKRLIGGLTAGAGK